MRAVAVLIAVCVGMSPTYAQTSRTYFEMSPRDTDELRRLLTGLETTIADELVDTDPIVVVLHGAEAAAFTRDNYARYKDLVDKAALMDAHKLIDVKMCARWMEQNGVQQSDLPAFVETVPFYGDELDRLHREGYVEHPRVPL